MKTKQKQNKDRMILFYMSLTLITLFFYDFIREIQSVSVV